MEFWENIFQNNTKMWGEHPADIAIRVANTFKTQGIKHMLLPGFGYGRNAKPFLEKGIQVTGIEISATAIERAKKLCGKQVVIHHGSVTQMPYDAIMYEGIFCHSLIHLFNETERKQFIASCYNQLLPGGRMVFTALTVSDKRFGIGKRLEQNTFFSPNGLTLYFYDTEAIQTEFGKYGLSEFKEISEPEVNPTEKLWLVTCKKHV